MKHVSKSWRFCPKTAGGATAVERPPARFCTASSGSLETGAPWRGLPERYGQWQTCYERFVRWRFDRTRDRFLAHAQTESGSSVPEIPFQNRLPAGGGIPVVGLAGHLDLRVVPGVEWGREVHDCLALRCRPEGSAADSPATVLLLGVVPHLVVLVLPEFGQVPHL